MSFIDDSSQYPELGEYIVESSPIGKVFIPGKDVDIVGDIGIRYEKHPWIERFEFDGLHPHTPVRKGYGTRKARAFAESLSKIYAFAYDDYALFCDDSLKSEENADGLDTEAYFSKAAQYFLRAATDAESLPMFRKFCGFTENMWRDGTKTMHDVALGIILPIIESRADTREIFYEVITPEFREYIGEQSYGKKES